MTDQSIEHVSEGGTEPAPQPLASRLVQAAPGLVRIAVISGWHLAEWSIRTSVSTGRAVVQTLASGKLPVAMFQDTLADLRSAGRQALGLSEDAEVVPPSSNGSVASVTAELTARGAELLYRSADVWLAEDVHPAYERILDELAPDEARILRFLSTDGPQPAVDIRTGRPFGIGSELVAGGLSMIGLRSGVRDMARTNAYSNNLFRLGLIWFSREEVEPVRYQVVEVQPDVVAAIKLAGRLPRTVRRSIHLTPFGLDFCRTCLPIPEEDFWDGTRASS